MAGRLIICGTPIGNLDDASPRLREALSEADVVYAEDTRRSRVLLNNLGVDQRLRSYFVGNEQERAAELGVHLEDGKTVVLITDAGMPSISDPGLTAVRAARRVGATVSVVPGPSAVTAALAVSGMPADRFVFEGFLPRKGSAREARLADLAGEMRTIVLFSSTRRVEQDLTDLAAVLGADRPVAIARELTKRFEEVWWSSLGEATVRLRAAPPKGEFTLVVQGAPMSAPSLEPALAQVMQRIQQGDRLADAVRAVAAEQGIGRRQLYEAALGAKQQPLGSD